MLIRDAVAALGYEEDATQELCIARPHQGAMQQRTLSQCGMRELGDLADVYIRAGAFRPGAIQSNGTGSTRGNLVRTYDLAFDFDLTDYTGLAKGDVLRLTDGERDLYLSALCDDAREVLSLCDIPIVTWVSTGYGLLALARLATPDQTRIDDATALHAFLVDRVNTVHGSRLADPQVNDGGTRLIRLPGCINTKGPVARPCTILHELDGDTLLHIDAISERPQRPPPRRIIPAHSRGLTEEQEAHVILAITNDYVEGSRHGIALGVAGLLAKAGIPRGVAERIISAVCAADVEAGDRLRAVRTTYDRIERGLDVRGYRHLEEFLSPAVLSYVDAILDTVRVTKDITIEFMVEKREAVITPDPAPCPQEALYGWFNAYCEIMTPTTEACAAFHLGTGLVYAGSLAGRRVSTHSGGALYPNLYLTLVGETGKSRKSTAMKRGQSFFRGPPPTPGQLISQPFSTLRGVTSGEGLIDHLAESPRTLLSLDELSLLVRKARRQSTLTLIPTLIDLWDAPERVDIPRAGKDGRQGVDHPCLSLLAATTPQTLADDMSGADIESGFANRVLWIFGEATQRLASPPKPDMARSGRLYTELREALALYPANTELTLDAPATQMWEDWYARDGERAYTNETEAQMAQRLGALIHKVALIYAASEAAPFINEDHLGAAIALVEWSFEATRAHARRWGWDEDARLGSQILAALAGGPMRNTDLARYLGERVSAPRMQKVLEALVKTGQVGLCSPGTYGVVR
jgi:hypothetical protein